MTYVMSDIHGKYKNYETMLEKINLSTKDSLYILGDVLDRGNQGCHILLDLAQRDNVILLAGNHDQVALSCLTLMEKSSSTDEKKQLDTKSFAMVTEWLQYLGGKATFQEYQSLDPDEKTRVLDYLGEMDLYEELEIEGKQFVLAHTLGHQDFSPEKDLGDYPLESLLWQRCDYEREYFPDKFLITGHTPTKIIPDGVEGQIFQKNNHIAIDCGPHCLGCLCLDTMEEFYCF